VGIVVITLAIPLLIQSFDLIRKGYGEMQAYRHERPGVAYLAGISEAVAANAAHRWALRDALAGVPSEAGGPAQAQSRLAEAFARLEAMDRDAGGELGIQGALEKLRPLVQSLGAAGAEDRQPFAAHDGIDQELDGLVGRLFENAGLAVDSHVDTTYLISSAVFDCVPLIGAIGRARGAGLDTPRAGKLGLEERRALQNAHETVHFLQRELRSDLSKAVAVNANLAGKVNPEAALASLERFASLLADGALLEPSGVDPASLRQAASQALHEQSDQTRRTLAALDDAIALHEQAARLRYWAFVGLLVLSTLLCAYACYSFYLVMNGGLRSSPSTRAWRRRAPASSAAASPSWPRK
jgi:hypothetical protein